MGVAKQARTWVLLFSHRTQTTKKSTTEGMTKPTVKGRWEGNRGKRGSGMEKKLIGGNRNA